MTRFLRYASWLGFLALAFQASAQNPNYQTLHNLLIQFYGYQRAGDKTIDNKNPFYKTAPYPHSNDNIGGKDLSSGWYDAGDFVKFGLPFGFSAYILLKGYDVFPGGFDDVTTWDYKGTPDEIPDILGEVKIATDYIMRAVVSSSQIIVDVGNADQDHGDLNETGYQNSSRIPNRTVYSTAGADVAGLYSATLALMAKLYQKHDAAYAAACLAKAKEAFAFGVANQKLSTQQKNGEFYKTATFKDKMACAAVELYRATNEATYLTQAKSFQAGVAQHFFVLSYANVGDISAFELARLGEGVSGAWLSDVAFTMNRVVTASTASALIKGAFINSDWGNAGNAASAGFSAALAFMISGDSKYLDFARSQAHWVAGLSPFTQSYIVGFGTNAPTAPHHRNDVTKLNGVRLKGGVVSGPSPSGTFNPEMPQNSSWSFNGNDAANYKNTEVALNYNAGMVGLVGFLRDYDNPPAGTVRITTGLTSTPGNVDLNTQTASISAVIAPASPWKVVLTGRTSKAKRTVSGTGAAVAVTWAGQVDSGSFVSGEAVDVVLDIPKIAPYHLSRAATVLYITGLKKEAFKATDIVVDDFEDADTLNKVGGSWRIFTDKPTGTSSTSPFNIAGAIVAAVGEADSKGLSIRLVSGTGAPRPFSGVATTFNAAGTAVSLGNAASVVFDIKAAAGASLVVELEQSDITDGAYPGYKIDFAGDAWNRIRIPIAAFAQPEWKTSARALNPQSVKSLRFTYYGTANVRFNLDNLRIEDLAIGTAPVVAQAKKNTDFTFLGADKDGINYRFVPSEAGVAAWKVEVMDIFGRVLSEQSIERPKAGAMRVHGVRLGPGWYFLRHTAPDVKREYIHRIRVGVDGR